MPASTQSHRTSVLALIPARAGSKGVPGKNMRLLGGEPLIGYTIRAAVSATRITRVVVSTDSASTAEFATSRGADVPFLRPAEISSDTAAMVDVVKHALIWLKDHEDFVPGFVALLQPTVPFRTADDIDRAVEHLESSRADAVVSVAPVPSHHGAQWQLRLRQGWLETCGGESLASLPSRRQALDLTYIRDGSLYIFRTDAFGRSGSIYGEKTAAVIHETPPINIDTLDDWSRAEAWLGDRAQR